MSLENKENPIKEEKEKEINDENKKNITDHDDPDKSSSKVEVYDWCDLHDCPMRRWKAAMRNYMYGVI